MAPLVLVCGDPAQARRITEHLEDARHVGNRTLSRTDPDQNLNVLDLHSREMPVGADESGALLDTLASRADRLWPFETWPPMRFDRELSVGARGGHGPIRYSVSEYEPGRRIRFQFHAPRGFDGYHEYRTEPLDGRRSRIVHELRMETSGAASLSWPLVYRPLHDALIEDSLTKAGSSLGVEPEIVKWPLRVRVLRWVLSVFLGRKAPRPRTTI